MRSLIITILLVLSISVFGQNHFIGLKGGVNWTNVNSSNFLNDNNNRTGFNGGLTYELQFNKNYNFGLDFLYAQKGFTNDIIFTDETGNSTDEKATSIFYYDYLSFPVKGGFLMGEKISGFVNFGIVPSFLIDAKHITTAIDNILEEETIEVTDRVTKLDFAGLIEIGGSYKFGNKFIIFTSFDYQQSFTTITNSDYFSNSKVRHYGMTMSIGLKYALNKE